MTADQRLAAAAADLARAAFVDALDVAADVAMEETTTYAIFAPIDDTEFDIVMEATHRAIAAARACALRQFPEYVRDQ